MWQSFWLAVVARDSSHDARNLMLESLVYSSSYAAFWLGCSGDDGQGRITCQACFYPNKESRQEELRRLRRGRNTLIFRAICLICFVIGPRPARPHPHRNAVTFR